MSRIKTLRLVVFTALGIIMVRLFFIQIIEHDKWVAKAEAEHTLLETITARRGEIYMMDGNEPVPVVLNQTVYSVIIDPSITSRDRLTEALEAHAKSYITADLDKVYSIEGLRYYVVAKNVPYPSAVALAEEGVPGVWLKPSNQRVYPEGEMASTLLGFVNADGVGQYGVEGALNQLLAGTDGLLKTTADINNVALSIGKDNIKIPAEDGKNVVLSIDRGLERGLEERTMEILADHSATNAAFLVMDPRDGRILAMSTLPNYDPANYGHVADASVYVNHVTDVPYEPASICKSFTYSAAINEGKMTAETTYYNTGVEYVDGLPIYNAEQRASINDQYLSMKTALSWSLNTGSIHALKLLGDNPSAITATGRERLYDYYHNRFRLDQRTGIEISEAKGFVWDPHADTNGLDAAYANMTFGQNLNITMLATATAFSAVINGGYYRTPSIVAGTLSNGIISPLPDREILDEQIISAETSAAMRDMLQNNRAFRVRSGVDPAGYDLGGKSGTAQVIINGAYDDSFSSLIGSYIGYIAPAGEMPQYVIMVKMWGEGQAVGSGEAEAIFNAAAHYLIDYMKVKPNYE